MHHAYFIISQQYILSSSLFSRCCLSTTWSFVQSLFCTLRFSSFFYFSSLQKLHHQSFPTLPSLFCYLSFFSVFLLILFSYSHSFVSICICHISLIQFSISSYHLFLISHLCSYSIFYNLYRRYILRFLANNSWLIYSSQASQGRNFIAIMTQETLPLVCKCDI